MLLNSQKRVPLPHRLQSSPDQNLPLSRVRKFKTPSLSPENTARSTKTQRDLAALRAMGKVERGSRVLANSRAFGGMVSANAEAEDYEGTLSLHCVELLDRMRGNE